MLAAPAYHRGSPQPGADFDCREDPDWLIIVLEEDSDLVNLKFLELLSLRHEVIEAAGNCNCCFYPTGHSVPRDAFDTGDGRLADTQARAEGPAAGSASVPPPPAALESDE